MCNANRKVKLGIESRLSSDFKQGIKLHLPSKKIAIKHSGMTNSELIQNFYESFASGNAEAMINCYDSNIEFSDPAFGKLTGNDAKNMWRMLIARSNGEIKITFGNIESNDKTGSANWTAEYVFSQTGRKVTNKIAAKFEFENGKIIKHTDQFDLWKWFRQALGWKGFLLGWTGFMKSKIQKQTNYLLKSYSKQ